MDRREFFTAKAKDRTLSSKANNQFPRTFSGLARYSGPWTKNEVRHLLKRTMFGATRSDIDYFLSRGLDASVDELLTLPTSPPTPPVKNYTNNFIPATDPDYAINGGETWININASSAIADQFRRDSFKSWWLGHMLNQQRSITEKMTLFWHNHFSTKANDIGRAIWAYKNNVLCRQYALGNFKQLVKEMTIDVAMLKFLNGYLNVKTSPDENYSRELQELFTLGKENNPNYTEDDVKNAAKVLTGWKIDNTTNTHFFNPALHETSSKQFSSFYNNTVIAGRSGSTAGELELNDLVDMIFTKEIEVSRFIVKKIYRYFVYYKIDAATEANVINPLAQILVVSNWEIKPVLEALFKSEHFFDALNRSCYIKSPIDLIVGLCREYEVVFPDHADYETSYYMWSYLYVFGNQLQQHIGDPPDVAGWKAYYQSPQFHEIWINTDTYPGRNYFTDVMIGSGYTKNGFKMIIDAVEFTKKVSSNPSDPNLLIEHASKFILTNELTTARKAKIKRQILLSNQDQDYYWTNAWNAYVANPTPANYQVVFFRLRDMYKYLMNLAEYQLC